MPPGAATEAVVALLEQGKAITDRIRDGVAEMEQAEAELSTRRRAAPEQTEAVGHLRNGGPTSSTCSLWRRFVPRLW